MLINYGALQIAFGKAIDHFMLRHFVLSLPFELSGDREEAAKKL